MALIDYIHIYMGEEKEREGEREKERASGRRGDSMQPLIPSSVPLLSIITYIVERDARVWRRTKPRLWTKLIYIITYTCVFVEKKSWECE